MTRWEPDARGRLARAALELYAEAGYEETTVADIAARAGLTERSFFRHFADKREVLFDGAGELQQRVCSAVSAAPSAAGPLEAVAAAFAGASVLFAGRRDAVRRRATTIATNPSLQERDLLKLARLGAAVADALRDRGLPETAALLGADMGVAVFRVAFDRWLAGSTEDLERCVYETFDELRALSSAPAARV